MLITLLIIMRIHHIKTFSLFVKLYMEKQQFKWMLYNSYFIARDWIGFSSLLLTVPVLRGHVCCFHAWGSSQSLRPTSCCFLQQKQQNKQRRQWFHKSSFINYKNDDWHHPASFPVWQHTMYLCATRKWHDLALVRIIYLQNVLSFCDSLGTRDSLNIDLKQTIGAYWHLAETSVPLNTTSFKPLLQF